jgi:hypothetical protein
MSRFAEFLRVFWQYRSHSIAYAARIAYGCAFRKLPF